MSKPCTSFIFPLFWIISQPRHIHTLETSNTVIPRGFLWGISWSQWWHTCWSSDRNSRWNHRSGYLHPNQVKTIQQFPSKRLPRGSDVTRDQSRGLVMSRCLALHRLLCPAAARGDVQCLTSSAASLDKQLAMLIAGKSLSCPQLAPETSALTSKTHSVTLLTK